MIICSCNVLSDQDVRSAVTSARPRTPGQVYGCLGCSAQCGRCARAIKQIMTEALQVTPIGCGACPRQLAAKLHPDAECEQHERPAQVSVAA